LNHDGPCYLRVGRPNVPIVYSDGCDMTLGKANRLRDGSDVTLIANGLMVAASLEAAANLAGEGIEARVLDVHTVKPLDRDAVAEAARETGALVVAEEHLHHGGLGSVVASAAAEIVPVPIRFVDLGDRFAESGPAEALLEKYGLTAADIAKAAREAVAAKG
jgi:transketolase